MELPRRRDHWEEEAMHEWRERVALMLEAEPLARPERVREAEDTAEALVRQAWRGR